MSAKRKGVKQGPSIAEIRTAVADLLRHVGCGCCGDRDALHEQEAVVGKMLGVRKYSDNSGYDFPRYRTKDSR